MSIYEVTYWTLESLGRENELDTLEDFNSNIRQIHDIVESAAMDYIRLQQGRSQGRVSSNDIGGTMTNQEQYDKICKDSETLKSLEEKLDRTEKQRNALIIALYFD